MEKQNGEEEKKTHNSYFALCLPDESNPRSQVPMTQSMTVLYCRHKFRNTSTSLRSETSYLLL
jgi:hypothetical protein